MPIVNPNQQGCGFGSGIWLALGVAFYLMAVLKVICSNSVWFTQQNISSHRMSLDYLDLVALGTVAACQWRWITTIVF